jgi:hypothetical protein
MYERVLGPDHPALLPPLRRLATVYLKTGDDRAEEMVKRALGLVEAGTREMNAETKRLNADRARRKGQS